MKLNGPFLFILATLMIDADQGEKAWEHLLSAACGLPEDGPINWRIRLPPRAHDG